MFIVEILLKQLLLLQKTKIITIAEFVENEEIFNILDELG